ncbi:hypothetical protein HI914_03667 [Erysiphe necator]|nr:hypothetical protein HI914_03667 [Erysiphe necator]
MREDLIHFFSKYDQIKYLITGDSPNALRLVIGIERSIRNLIREESQILYWDKLCVEVFTPEIFITNLKC